MRDNIPARLLLEDGEGGRRDFFSENNLHVDFLFLFGWPHHCGKDGKNLECESLV
jgi:hypothetical protein